MTIIPKSHQPTLSYAYYTKSNKRTGLTKHLCFLFGPISLQRATSDLDGVAPDVLHVLDPSWQAYVKRRTTSAFQYDPP